MTLLAPEKVERILVCQLRQLGDVLLATPSIELLARQYPRAQIHVFTEQKCLPMLANNPHIARVWPLDKKSLPSLLHELIYYHQVASNRFDLVVDFQQLPRCRWVVGMSRAPVRLSFPPPWYLRPLYTHWRRPAPAYAAAYKADLLRVLGIHWQGERPRLYLTEEERAQGLEILRDLGLAGNSFISVDASHRHITRRWPAEHYAALMDMLAKDSPGLRFLLPYGPGEEKEMRTLRELCVCKDHVHVPSSMLGLRQLAACMEHAALHLGNCSAPRHMAVALQIPSFTILGATSQGWTFPAPEHMAVQAKDFMPMPCQSCNANSCSAGLPCLKELRPAMLFPLLKEHLRAFGRSLYAPPSPHGA